ncbi:hypothetical protein [Perlucidibaca piscinae]|uniref:hypothetical protein n=1 Tax=Perlucidibaca piscinae TaxID=392589 RepID=UPI0003B31ABE|nr:hypothetical protein [Perlucidibaca piscinae]
MKTFIQKLDSNLCLCFCMMKGFIRLIDQMELEDVAHVVTESRKARAGWTDWQ